MNCGHGKVPENATLIPNVFMSKFLSSTEPCYGNIESEVLGILHGLEKSHHYCFSKNAFIIIDHKPLVVILSNDMVTLFQWLQCLMLCLHQYRVHIVYIPCPDL